MNKRNDSSIRGMFVVKEGMFAETSKLFVINSNGTCSLYSYPKMIFLSGSDIHSKAFLKDNYEGVTYDISKGDNLYNYTSFAYDYYKLCDRYKASIEDGGFDLNISNLYDNPEDTSSLEKIEKCKKALRMTCLLRAISYEKDPSKILQRVVKRIEDNPDPIFPEFKEPSVLFCTSKESVDEYCNKNMAKFQTDYDYEKFARDIYGVSGASGRIIFKYFGHLLSEAHLLNDAYYLRSFNNSNAIIKEYMEFLIAFPYFSKILKQLSEYSRKCDDKARELKFKDFYDSPEFIESLRNMIDDSEGYNLYYHATTDRETAQKIIDEGLYSYSANLSSTAMSGLSLNGILDYGYGNGINMYDKYIVVLRVPQGEDVVRPLTPEERDAAAVFPRRMAITDKPEYIIDSKYVVGFVDKERKELVVNPHIEKNHERGRS